MNQPFDPPLAAGQMPPFYQTDLIMPSYRAGGFGDWQVRIGGFGIDRGYHSGLWCTQNLPLLLRKNAGGGWETWMSLSVHEVESQELPCRYAAGTVVIMGLGMGWVAINVAARAAVQKIVVIEHDPAVISLFRESGATNALPDDCRRKIEVVEADALTWRPTEPVDLLYADIWLTLAEPQTLGEVQRMQGNVDARQVCFWGQEISLYAQSEAWRNGEEPLSMDLFRRCASERLKLPLLLPDGIDYPALIERVVANRRQRQLPVR